MLLPTGNDQAHSHILTTCAWNSADAQKTTLTCIGRAPSGFHFASINFCRVRDDRESVVAAAITRFAIIAENMNRGRDHRGEYESRPINRVFFEIARFAQLCYVTIVWMSSINIKIVSLPSPFHFLSNHQSIPKHFHPKHFHLSKHFIQNTFINPFQNTFKLLWHATALCLVFV